MTDLKQQEHNELYKKCLKNTLLVTKGKYLPLILQDHLNHNLIHLVQEEYINEILEKKYNKWLQRQQQNKQKKPHPQMTYFEYRDSLIDTFSDLIECYPSLKQIFDYDLNYLLNFKRCRNVLKNISYDITVNDFYVTTNHFTSKTDFLNKWNWISNSLAEDPYDCY